MDYSLRELECFIAVAEELSFTRAAKNLRLAQPPLSRHVRVLEEKVGARLFDREGRRVALTSAGAVFYEETRRILPQLRRAREAVQRALSGEVARLRLGFVSAVLSPDLLDTLKRFRHRYPKVQLEMHDGTPGEQLDRLARGLLDGGFVGLKPVERAAGIHFTSWRKELLRVFVPFGHPLAEREEVTLKALAQESWVAVASEAAPAYYSYVQSLCATVGFRPRVVLESPRAQAVVVMVAAGSGIALLPASLAHVAGPAVKVLTLRPAASITHVFARAAGTMSAPLRSFVDLLEE